MPAPASSSEIVADLVHVRLVALDLPGARLAVLAAALGPDERRRAARFHAPRDRDRFVAARGMLRVLLSRYVGCPPAQLVFTYGAHGKPALAEPACDLQFNLSHAHGLALYAFTRGRRVGVDLERVRPLDDADALAERFFSPPERTVLRALPPAARQEAFFTCWTRKEAYVKARGEGLTHPLDTFVVPLLPGEAPTVRPAPGVPPSPTPWTLHGWRPAAGFVAAVAAEGQDWHPHFAPLPCRPPATAL